MLEVCGEGIIQMSQQQFLTKLRGVLDAFEDFDITPSQFFGGLLTTHIFEDRQTTISLAEDVVSILEIFNSASSTSKSTERWIFRVAETKYKAQVLTLTKKESGFHFLASKATTSQLMNTHIDSLGSDMKNIAPDLWRLLAELHAADPAANERRVDLAHKRAGAITKPNQRSNDGDISMMDAADGGDNESWEIIDSNDIHLVDEEEDAPEDLSDHVKTQFDALVKIVSP